MLIVYFHAQILLAIGGWSGGTPTNAIEAYDPRAETWVNISTMPGCSCISKYNWSRVISTNKE